MYIDAKSGRELAFALFVTAVVFTVAAIANNNLQDLKTGQLVDATPSMQQWALVVGVIAGVVYPAGTGQPPIASVGVKVYHGWPDRNTLNADIAAGRAHVSVWPTPTVRPTTGLSSDWYELSRTAATLTATVAGQTITIAGTVSVPQAVALLIDQRRRGLANRCFPTRGTLPALSCGDGIVRYLRCPANAVPEGSCDGGRRCSVVATHNLVGSAPRRENHALNRAFIFCSPNRGRSETVGLTVRSRDSDRASLKAEIYRLKRPAKPRNGRSALVSSPGGAATTEAIAFSAGSPVTVMPIDANDSGSDRSTPGLAKIMCLL